MLNLALLASCRFSQTDAARTATGPRSQRVEADNGVENPKDLCRGNALRAGTARGPILRTDATMIIAHGARSHGSAVTLFRRVTAC